MSECKFKEEMDALRRERDALRAKLRKYEPVECSEAITLVENQIASVQTGFSESTFGPNALITLPVIWVKHLVVLAKAYERGGT